MDADAVAETFAARISPRLVNLATGELLEKDPAKFNQAQALKDPQQSIALDASRDLAGIKRRSNLAEIYLVRDAQQQIEQMVLPIYGNGLWSMMYAFVALDVDGRTVKGITYYDQGKPRGWAAKWRTRTGASSLLASRCWMTTACRHSGW